MSMTMKKDLIIPEVVGEMVESKFGGHISLLPFADYDKTLEGIPGDTLKFPCFRYIGQAEEVAENGEVRAATLSADTVTVAVKKYAKAVCITDEARLSGFGDPVGEAAAQLAAAIDHAVDAALFEALSTLPLHRKAVVKGLSSEAIADALALFGEELEGDKILLTDAEGFAQLRKDSGYIRASDLGQRMICAGVVGEVWGCQILLSNRIRENKAKGEKCIYILKKGALRLVSKQGVRLEVKREPDFMRDTLYASKHCAAYLYNAGYALDLTQFTGLEALKRDCGIHCEEGATTGSTRLRIPENLRAPRGCRWVYKADNVAANAGSFGTALTGFADYVSDETDIPAASQAYLHVCLVGADQKPLKTTTVAVVSL